MSEDEGTKREHLGTFNTLEEALAFAAGTMDPGARIWFQHEGSEETLPIAEAFKIGEKKND